MEDSAIVELYLQRNEAAIDETAEKYSKRLKALANRVLEDEGAAEECENDTYLTAWKSIPPNKPTTYFFPFLAKITRHIALDYCRSRNRQKRSAVQTALSDELQECIPAKDDVEKQIDGVLLGGIISAYLRGIRIEQRNVFLRRYWYFDSVADIAKHFNISESKVKAILFRCRNGLKKHLEQEGIL